MVGTINGQGQVEKVQTWIDQSIVGDMLVETTYSGYRNFGGVTFPSRIAQTQDGYPALDLTISSVTANPMFDAPVPDNVRNAPAAATPMVAVEKLAEGVFYLTGATHHSLAIEMRDHIVVVDTPNNEARAAAVLAKAKEIIRELELSGHRLQGQLLDRHRAGRRHAAGGRAARLDLAQRRRRRALGAGGDRQQEFDHRLRCRRRRGRRGRAGRLAGLEQRRRAQLRHQRA
jgi:hypothetical protein